MSYKLVIFDFDGTLANTFPWFAANFNHAAKLFRFKQIRDEEFESLRRLNAREIIAHLNVAWWKLPLVTIYMRWLMSRDLASIQLFPDVEEVLDVLREHQVKIAIVSSNSEKNIRTILGPLAQKIDYFKCGSSLFGKTKKFQKLLFKISYSPDEVLCIGDEVRDIEAARALSLHCGSVLWGYAHPEVLKSKSPDHVFTSMRDIAFLLKKS